MSEISDTATLVKLGGQGTYYLIKGSVKGILYLYQTLKKLNAAKVLGNGEVENFEKFLKATEGKYKILNVPTENPEEIARMKGDLDKLHIGYKVLPDLNVGDGQIQVAYAIEDMDKIESWYRSFCLDHLQTGGEKSYRELVNFTDGQISIVNIPWSDKNASVENMAEQAEKIREVLANSGFTYSKGILPALDPRKKHTPVIVLSYRAEEFKKWYSQQQTEPLQEEPTIHSVRDYLSEGDMDEYTYADTADRKNKEILKPNKDVKLDFKNPEMVVKVMTQEGNLQKMKVDLDRLHINYTILPDLNVGDGYIQIAFATADAPKMKAWYEAYQSDMLAAGVSVEPMREISMEEYRKNTSAPEPKSPFEILLDKREKEKLASTLPVEESVHSMEKTVKKAVEKVVKKAAPVPKL